MIRSRGRGWRSACATLLFLLLFVTVVRGAPPRAAVATAHPLATEAGVQMLAEGGNAFDAAVAVSAALAVVEPAGSGLGGGGFWLLHRASDGRQWMVDGRERAPLAATRDMYLDDRGRFDPKRAQDGPLAAGIPGMPAALVHMAKYYGRLPLSKSLAPAIRYARYGFALGNRHLRMVEIRLETLRNFPAAAEIFLPHNRLPMPGSMLVQPDLARTLEALAEQGRDGFYGGQVANRLVDGVREAGGNWTRADLETYQVIERQPVVGEYRGIRVVSASPPSSGGVVLVEALNVLSGFDLESVEPAVRKHLVVEAMRRAYRDRALFLGDPDFVDMPVARLLDTDYAAGLRVGIRTDRASPSRELAGDLMAEPEGQDTTHFSIIDSEGNRVAATLSINFPFGSGFVVPGTGVVLNDEMDDFVGQPGAPNGYGLVGGEANAIVGGKRMLSSMTPTFLETDDRIAVLGTPGGSRIISMVLLAVLDFAAGHGPDSWVEVPRYHHQFLPDVIQYEKGALTDSERQSLLGLGHRLLEKPYRYGNMQAVQWDKGRSRVSAASDPRGEGLAVVR